jgi:hypothetical protein
MKTENWIQLGIGLFLVSVVAKAFKNFLPGGMFDGPGKMPELFGLNASEYTDATPEQRRAVQNRFPVLDLAAGAISEAAGMVNDNEALVLSAFLVPRSRFEVYWLSKRFVAVNTRTLGVFTTPVDAGDFMMQFVDLDTWGKVYDRYKQLPKY